MCTNGTNSTAISIAVFYSKSPAIGGLWYVTPTKHKIKDPYIVNEITLSKCIFINVMVYLLHI